MKVALDTSPLSSGHKYRGTGFYVRHLKDALEKYFPEHSYFFFSKRDQIPKSVDIIHYPYFDPFSLTIPFSQRKKTVVTVLDLIPILFPQEFPAGIKGNIKWFMQKNALKTVAGVIADSQSAKRDIENLTGIQSDNITVTYLAAGEKFRQVSKTTSEMADLKKKYNLPEKFALYVGDVTWNKNLPRLVQACMQTSIRLVMVGKSLVNKNFDKNNMWNRDLVKVLQLAENNSFIQRLGFVSDEDLVLLYNLATVFAMPSLYEGFGLPVLEAMQCGCPVIAGQEASLPEVAGNAAYFVDAHSTDSIARGINEVMSSNTLRLTLSKKGLEQVKNFSWRKTAQETIALYKRLTR